MPLTILPDELDRNAVLAALPRADRARLAAKLSRYEFSHEVLAEAGDRLTDAYFPVNGLISIVAVLKDAEIEVGTVAREGMIGLPLILGSGVSEHRVISQISGTGFQLTSSALIAERKASAALGEVLL